jgi:hypothetical protein
MRCFRCDVMASWDGWIDGLMLAATFSGYMYVGLSISWPW